MRDRESALRQVWQAGVYGKLGTPRIRFEQRSDLVLHQVAAWPDTVTTVARRLSELTGCAEAPAAGSVSVGAGGCLMRVEPLKWWVLGVVAPTSDAATSVGVDLSHSRVWLCVAGPDSALLLNRYLPIDLRDQWFPPGRLATTAMHHTPVTLWHSTDGYELFLPRSFAQSLFELLCEGALPFGYEIRN